MTYNNPLQEHRDGSTCKFSSYFSVYKGHYLAQHGDNTFLWTLFLSSSSSLPRLFDRKMHRHNRFVSFIVCVTHHLGTKNNVWEFTSTSGLIAVSLVLPERFIYFYKNLIKYSWCHISCKSLVCVVCDLSFTTFKHRLI